MSKHALAHENSPVRDASGDGLGAAPSVDLLTNRRTADPVVVALLDHVRRGTAEEQLFLFRAAARRLRVALDDARDEVIEAAQACMRDRGLRSAPSRTTYRAWRNDQPAWREWPSDHVAARAFDGSWPRLRAAIDDEPIADMRALAISRLGSPSEDAALLHGLRRWHAAEPDTRFRFASFRKWAKKNLHLDERQHAFRRGELPSSETLHVALSPNTYITRFGSWFAALDQAGVLAGIPFDAYARIAKTDRYVSDEVIFALLADAERASRETTGRALTRAGFDAYRSRRLRGSWESGALEPVPSAGMIVKRFGSLIDAMVAAGLWDAGQAGRRSVRRGAKLTLEELGAWATACARDLGLEVIDLPRAEYIRWRDRVVGQLLEPIPSHPTFTCRFETGSWPKAMAKIAQLNVPEARVADLMAYIESAGHDRGRCP